MRITANDWDELDAIHETVCAIGRPTFQHRKNWPRLEQLRDAGLIELGPHPEFSKDYYAVSLTQAGMFRLWKKRMAPTKKAA
jgi:hypothetical protein